MPDRSDIRLLARINSGRLLIAGLLALVSTTNCFAEVGLGEWAIETPGKNHIARADPLAEEHGVCLYGPVKAGDTPTDKDVLVAHIKWWRYYENFVVGEAKKGLFVFDERAKAVKYCGDQAGLDRRIKSMKIGKPTSRRMVPRDGWKLVWGPTMRRMYQQQLKDLKEGRGIAKELGPAERETLEKSIQRMLKELEEDDASLQSGATARGK